MNPSFWEGKRVLVTGHTGFKGGWLTLWLKRMRAEVTGFSQPPDTDPSLFVTANVGEGVHSIVGDVRELDSVRQAFARHEPEIVIHMAAQTIVRAGYEDPTGTFATNVIGTANVLEAARGTAAVRVVVVVTSDKCYENREWNWGYRENDALGGHDPYSASKACAELVTAAFRESFFQPADPLARTPAAATVSAGNVIGGGDWARDRIIPDTVRAFASGRPLVLRYPRAIRPWQHVLEPLCGYLTLAERLWEDRVQYAGRWNFGPGENDAKSVQWVVERVASLWGGDCRWEHQGRSNPHEAHHLRLDSTKSRTFLDWTPRLGIETAIEWLVEWYRGWADGRDVRKLTEQQIERYEQLAPGRGAAS